MRNEDGIIWKAPERENIFFDIYVQTWKLQNISHDSISSHYIVSSKASHKSVAYFKTGEKIKFIAILFLHNTLRQALIMK